jgi:prepilin-type N-terminal cleavage/methylation domain-containing protein
MMRNSQGFTLIEVLVASTLAAIVMTGLLTMNIGSMKADTQASRVSAATLLAQTKLEQLRILPRSHSGWGAGTHTEQGLQEGGGTGGKYTREWNVQLNYNNFDKLSRVTATVSWYESGKQNSVTLASLYW